MCAAIWLVSVVIFLVCVVFFLVCVVILLVRVVIWLVCVAILLVCEVISASMCSDFDLILRLVKPYWSISTRGTPPRPSFSALRSSSAGSFFKNCVGGFGSWVLGSGPKVLELGSRV